MSGVELNGLGVSGGTLIFHHVAVCRLCRSGDIPSQSCSAQGHARGLWAPSIIAGWHGAEAHKCLHAKSSQISLGSLTSFPCTPFPKKAAHANPDTTQPCCLSCGTAGRPSSPASLFWRCRFPLSHLPSSADAQSSILQWLFYSTSSASSAGVGFKHCRVAG